MVKNKLPSPTESDEQIALFEWAALQSRKYPELELLYHIPNGGHRHKTTAIRLKREGVKAGVPDICLPVPRGTYHGLYIELKAGRNTATGNQTKWLQALQSNGYFVAICHGWEVASNTITDYLSEPQGIYITLQENEKLREGLE